MRESRPEVATGLPEGKIHSALPLTFHSIRLGNSKGKQFQDEWGREAFGDLRKSSLQTHFEAGKIETSAHDPPS